MSIYKSLSNSSIATDQANASNEIEILSSIFNNNVEILEDSQQSKRISIKVQPSQFPYKCFIQLNIIFLIDYPFSDPRVDIVNFYNIETSHINELKSEIELIILKNKQSKSESAMEISLKALELVNFTNKIHNEEKKQVEKDSLLKKNTDFYYQNDDFQVYSEYKKFSGVYLDSTSKQKKKENNQFIEIDDNIPLFFKSNKKKQKTFPIRLTNQTSHQFASRFKEDFIIEDTIGKGGGGVVFKVKNKYDGMLYAVKKVKINLDDLENTKKLLKEVMVLSRIQHPNIVRYYQAWVEEMSQHYQSFVCSEYEGNNGDYNDEKVGGLSKKRSRSYHDQSEISCSGVSFSKINEKKRIEEVNNDDDDYNYDDKVVENKEETEKAKTSKFLNTINNIWEDSEEDKLTMNISNDKEKRGIWDESSSLTETEIKSQTKGNEYAYTDEIGIGCGYNISKASKGYSSIDDLKNDIVLNKDLKEKDILKQIDKKNENIEYIERSNGTSQRSSQSGVSQYKSCLSYKNEDIDEEEEEEDEEIEEETQKKPRKKHFLYIQMEFCEGKTVKEVIEGEINLTEKEKWRLIVQITEALVYIHSNKLIHRDLKPSNIFLDSNNHVKLGDFGLVTLNSFMGIRSEIVKTTRNEHIQTSNGVYLSCGIGTRYYCAPEQESGNIYNDKADMYSLGIIIFELFYKFGSLMEREIILKGIGNKTPFPKRFLDNTPENIVKIIKNLVNKDVNNRLSSKQLITSSLIPLNFNEKLVMHNFNKIISQNNTILPDIVSSVYSHVFENQYNNIGVIVRNTVETSKTYQNSVENLKFFTVFHISQQVKAIFKSFNAMKIDVQASITDFMKFHKKIELINTLNQLNSQNHPEIEVRSIKSIDLSLKNNVFLNKNSELYMLNSSLVSFFDYINSINTSTGKYFYNENSNFPIKSQSNMSFVSTWTNIVNSTKLNSDLFNEKEFLSCLIDVISYIKFPEKSKITIKINSSYLLDYVFERANLQKEKKLFFLNKHNENKENKKKSLFFISENELSQINVSKSKIKEVIDLINKLTGDFLSVKSKFDKNSFLFWYLNDVETLFSLVDKQLKVLNVSLIIEPSLVLPSDFYSGLMFSLDCQVNQPQNTFFHILHGGRVDALFHLKCTDSCTCLNHKNLEDSNLSWEKGYSYEKFSLSTELVNPIYKKIMSLPRTKKSLAMTIDLNVLYLLYRQYYKSESEERQVYRLVFLLESRIGFVVNNSQRGQSMFQNVRMSKESQMFSLNIDAEAEFQRIVSELESSKMGFEVIEPDYFPLFSIENMEKSEHSQVIVEERFLSLYSLYKMRIMLSLTVVNSKIFVYFSFFYLKKVKTEVRAVENFSLKETFKYVLDKQKDNSIFI